VENGPVELGKENMSTDENPAGKLLSIQGASPRLSPRVGMSKRDEQRHGSLRARLGLDSLHASFLRNSKISPVRRRRMTAEQVHAEEEGVLQSFKDLLNQEGIEIPRHMRFAGDLDATLLRFLRARKFNLEKTFEMITECIKWRKENNVETILDRPFDSKKLSVIRANSQSGYYGYDKKGQPIYIDRPGKLNVQKLLNSDITNEDILFKHVQEMEYMANVILWEASERAGHTIDSCLMILDVGGVKISDFTKEVKSILNTITKVDQDNYPETNGGTLIVNSSFIFTAIYRVVEAFLDKRTREKIKVLGTDKKSRARLLQYVEEDQLPQFLGGTAPDEVIVGQPGKPIPSHSAMDEYISRRARQSELLTAAGWELGGGIPSPTRTHIAEPSIARASESASVPTRHGTRELEISVEVAEVLASADQVLEQINRLSQEEIQQMKEHLTRINEQAVRGEIDAHNHNSDSTNTQQKIGNNQVEAKCCQIQ